MILPPTTLGVLGGGQLGRYFVLAAHELGYRTLVLDPDPRSVAGAAAHEHLVAAYDDPAALARVAARCAAVTTEFESVPADALAWLGTRVPVHPRAAAVASCQDRAAEKAFLLAHGFPQGPWAAVATAEDCARCDEALFPGILKVARCGYDGKGQARVADRRGLREAFAAFGRQPCVLERQLVLQAELSVVLARAADGATRCFPAAENRHRGGILDHSSVPVAPGLRASAAQAARVAAGIATALDYVGVLGVEFFVAGGELLVNEIAPRPHNSGHYTLDACAASQFEQQVRALCGLPLAEPAAHAAAVCVNLLGELWRDERGRAREPAWHRLLALPGARLHLYGKDEARPGRKMGHFTVIGQDTATIRRTVAFARAALGIDSNNDSEAAAHG